MINNTTALQTSAAVPVLLRTVFFYSGSAESIPTKQKKGPTTRIAGPKGNYDEIIIYSLKSALTAARASSSAARTLSIVS